MKSNWVEFRIRNYERESTDGCCPCCGRKSEKKETTCGCGQKYRWNRKELKHESINC